MRRVLAPIAHLHRIRISNVFLLDGGPGARWLVDSGHFVERATLLLELRRAGISPSELSGVLLTHRHSDHAGNAAFLQRWFGVKLHAHRADAEILEGSAPRSRLARREGSFVAGVLAEIENLLPARARIDRALDDGDEVAGLEVHWMPGHTEGSVFYRHERSRSLLSGDTLLMAHPPLTLRSGLALPYSSFATDLTQAFASLDAFHSSGFAYDNLLAGHGPPLLGDAREQVLRALERRRVQSPEVTRTPA